MKYNHAILEGQNVKIQVVFFKSLNLVCWGNPAREGILHHWECPAAGNYQADFLPGWTRRSSLVKDHSLRSTNDRSPSYSRVQSDTSCLISESKNQERHMSYFCAQSCIVPYLYLVALVGKLSICSTIDIFWEMYLHLQDLLIIYFSPPTYFFFFFFYR